MSVRILLVCDATLMGCFIASRWITHFGSSKRFAGIFVREEKRTKAVLASRSALHEKYADKKILSPYTLRELNDLYQPLNETEKTMIRLFGFPRYTFSSTSKVSFLGYDLNTEEVKQYVSEFKDQNSDLFLFTFLTQVIKPWWIRIFNRRIINGHSAVLPFARGIYSIENVAAARIRCEFERCAGASIHYLDEGVDTGPIIATDTIERPYSYNSIWELKAESYNRVSNLMLNEARRIIEIETYTPKGIVVPREKQGPEYRRSQFTESKKRQAQTGYLEMKEELCSNTARDIADSQV